jgi:hypothetical protein
MAERMRRLLVVEDTFLITGRGLIVMPPLPASEARPTQFAVDIRRCDGTCQRGEAFAQVPFITPPPAVPAAHLALLGVTKDEVPIGAEVWTAD